MEADDLAELSLADECTLNNIVVNSNQFVNLLAELDSSADVFELFTSPDAPFFKICTIGILVINATILLFHLFWNNFFF